MNKLSFREQKFAFRVLFLSLAFCFLLNQNALAQRTKSVTARVGTKSNATRNFAGDEYQIFSLVNNERRRKRLTDLVWDDQLARLARRYSEQMARGNFFSHYDQNGDSVVERARNARLKGWSKIGENLFFCEGLDDFNAFAVRGWMQSPSHRRNILDGAWTKTGIGVASTRDGRVYITQVFMKEGAL